MHARSINKQLISYWPKSFHIPRKKIDFNTNFPVHREFVDSHRRNISHFRFCILIYKPSPFSATLVIYNGSQIITKVKSSNEYKHYGRDTWMAYLCQEADIYDGVISPLLTIILEKRQGNCPCSNKQSSNIAFYIVHAGE